MKIFHAYIPGDITVGIRSMDSKITIEDEYDWDDEMIQAMKEHLAEFYEIKVSSVLTSDEYEREALRRKNEFDASKILK